MKSKATPPAVGRPARGTRTGRPIMVALDLLGRRNALRVLWELRDQPLTFRALQDAAATNPSLLNTRIKELREAALVALDAEGYRLTGPGMALLETLQPLSRWASGWAKALARAPLKP